MVKKYLYISSILISIVLYLDLLWNAFQSIYELDFLPGYFVLFTIIGIFILCWTAYFFHKDLLIILCLVPSAILTMIFGITLLQTFFILSAEDSTIDFGVFTYVISEFILLLPLSIYLIKTLRYKFLKNKIINKNKLTQK